MDKARFADISESSWMPMAIAGKSGYIRLQLDVAIVNTLIHVQFLLFEGQFTQTRDDLGIAICDTYLHTLTHIHQKVMITWFRLHLRQDVLLL